MAGKPGTREEAALLREWAKTHVKSSVAQLCKEQQNAVKNINRDDEEYY